jgi:hypothetical protein
MEICRCRAKHADTFEFGEQRGLLVEGDTQLFFKLFEEPPRRSKEVGPGRGANYEEICQSTDQGVPELSADSQFVLSLIRSLQLGDVNTTTKMETRRFSIRQDCYVHNTDKQHCTSRTDCHQQSFTRSTKLASSIYSHRYHTGETQDKLDRITGIVGKGTTNKTDTPRPNFTPGTILRHLNRWSPRMYESDAQVIRVASSAESIGRTGQSTAAASALRVALCSRLRVAIHMRNSGRYSASGSATLSERSVVIVKQTLSRGKTLQIEW